MSTNSRNRSPRPRVPAEEARGRIVAAANRLLCDRRYRDLTVEDVMAGAGLARTVFYRHFDGLPEIFLGLLDDLLAEVVAEAQASDPDDRETLRRQLALVVATYRRHGPLLLALDEAAHHHDHVEQAWRAWLDHTVEVTAELLDRGVARGHTPVMPVRDVARALTAMNGHYLLDLVSADPAFDAEAALEALWTVWMRTTWPGPASAPPGPAVPVDRAPGAPVDRAPGAPVAGVPGAPVDTGPGGAGGPVAPAAAQATAADRPASPTN